MFKKILINRGLHIILLLGLLSAALYVRIQDYDWTRSLRYLAFDYYNKTMPREKTDDVVIVDIDEISLGREGLGQWPWSRDAVAKIVRNLADMGAKAIVFDMVFAEKDRTSPSLIKQKLQENGLDTAAQSILESLPDNDMVFADAIREAGNVSMGFIWAQQDGATRRKPHLSRPFLLAKSAQTLPQSIPKIRNAATSIPELSAAAAGNGCFGVMTEVDGILRRVPLLFSYDDPDTGKISMYPSLALEALRVSQGARTLTKIRELKDSELDLLGAPLRMNVGQYEIPLDYDGQFYTYFAPARPQDYISAWKIFENQIDPAKIKDKIVFIGTSAEGLKDIRSTPLNLFIPGVEVHVNVVEQVLTGNYLLRPALLQGMELITIALTGLLIILLAPFIGSVIMAACTVMLTAGIAAMSWQAFSVHGLLLDPVYPGLCMLALFILSSLLTYIRSEADRKQVREAFGHYISPDYMKELTSNPDQLRLGGEVRDLSVMFTDVRSFTTISESLPPEELIQLMNDFLTPMSDMVMQNRGTIDKYMGDAMMAFWNAPLDDADHAKHACLAALKMSEALEPLNAELQIKAKAQGRDPVVINAGIGINSGPASVGNMGSKQRFAYSCLGDTVNLASRLEGQTKAYGVDILIGENTANAVPDFAVLELDLLRVKGKQLPERIFALLGDEEKSHSVEYQAWHEQHETLIKLYRTQKFDEALASIKKCKKYGLSEFYDMLRSRINDLKSTDLPADWDGVYEATSK